MTKRTVTLLDKATFIVLGEPVQVGAKAPAAAGRTGGFSTDTFDIINDTQDKIRVLVFVPSLNTGICSAQARKFNEVFEGSEKVVAVTISADLPFVQEQWCGAEGLDDAVMVSDHYNMAISDAYGTHIKELRLSQRGVVVVDAEGIVRYSEYCPEIAMHPDYDAAVAAVNALL
jgi:thiol peroxidase